MLVVNGWALPYEPINVSFYEQFIKLPVICGLCVFGYSKGVTMYVCIVLYHYYCVCDCKVCAIHAPLNLNLTLLFYAHAHMCTHTHTRAVQ